jgi:hypothetical protein
MSTFQIFSAAQIEFLRHGGKILRDCLNEVAKHVRPGITTKELDLIAEEFIRSHDGATPSFKGYHGFPATLCTSSDTMSPSLSTRVLGMPWTHWSLTDVHSVAGNPWYPLNAGVAPSWERMNSSAFPHSVVACTHSG